MALIPSESLSFPDSFRATVGWRISKIKDSGRMPPKLEPAPLIKAESSGPIRESIRAAHPPTEITAPKWEPIDVSAIETALRKEAAVPAESTEEVLVAEPDENSGRQSGTKSAAKIPIVPRKRFGFGQVSAQSSATPPVAPTELVDPSQLEFIDLVEGETAEGEKEVEPAPPEPAAREEIVVSEQRVEAEPLPEVPPPKLRPARPELIHSQIEFFTQNERRGRWIRFVLGETLALALLAGLLRVGLTQQFTDRALVALLAILIVTAFAAVVALPIFFVRNNPARWYRPRSK